MFLYLSGCLSNQFSFNVFLNHPQIGKVKTNTINDVKFLCTGIISPQLSQ